MMAVDGATEARTVDRNELRRALVTSSTKRRISELSGLPQQFEHDCMCTYRWFTAYGSTS